MKAKVFGTMAAVVFFAVEAAIGQTHAQWPTDWSNWDDPALWVTVGNAGNAADTRKQSDNTSGYGAVGYQYRISKYEVTAGQYCEFLNAVAKADPYGLYCIWMNDNARGCQITRHGTSGNYTYDFSGRPSGTTEADWVNRPATHVNWGDAARYANWLTNGKPTGAQGTGTTESGVYDLKGAWSDGDHMSVAVPSAAQRKAWSTGTKQYYLLPSEDEWYKAAYHDKTAGLGMSYFNYPTASNVQPSHHLVEPTDSGNNATFEEYTIGSPYWHTEVGAHENSESPYGSFDQGGNVVEWNESVIGSNRGVRGGSYLHYGSYMYALYREGYPPTLQETYTGFRIVLIPEPATLSLLALGGLAVVRRRSRLR